MIFALLVVASKQTTGREPHHNSSSCQSSDIQQSIQGNIVPENFFLFKTPVSTRITPLFTVKKQIIEKQHKLPAFNLRPYLLNLAGLKPPGWKSFRMNLYDTADNDDDHYLVA